MKIKTSRLLNEQTGFLGLSPWDIGALGYFLIISHASLKPYGLELLSFLFSALGFLILIHIRTKYRRKTIRDVLRHYLTKNSIK
jgi:hypothetical protein